MLRSIIAYVKKYQGEKGFILTDRDDKDAFYDIEFSPEDNSVNEFQIKAVRVIGNNLEILTDVNQVRYDEQSIRDADESDWESVEDSDTIYFKPTLFNIAENIRNYVDELAEFTFVDLGLPSRKLWATENVKDENGNEAFFSFDDSVDAFGRNLPSKDDWKELFDNSSYSWNEERKGYNMTGPNGNSIFLPAAGYHDGATLYYVGSGGYYWSSSVFSEYNAYRVYFYSGDLSPQGSTARYFGFSVRLVR
jgi:hypothetical protein